MEKPTNITRDVVGKLTPGTKLYDWFDHDNGSVILYGKVWWLETIQYADDLPDAQHKKLEALMLKEFHAKWLYAKAQ